MEEPGRAAGMRAGSLRAVRFGLCAFLALAAWTLPAPAWAGPPTEQLRGAIDNVIRTLKNPALAAKGKEEERRKLLREEIAPVFDFDEMAKQCLGPHWHGRTPEERRRFVELFRKLLEKSYLGKIESYHGETIRYGKESVDGPYAEVRTAVVTRNGQEIPLNYRMLDEGGRYRIYDVVIEGISLVNNYRAQFNSILGRTSFQGLLDKMRAVVRKGR